MGPPRSHPRPQLPPTGPSATLSKTSAITSNVYGAGAGGGPGLGPGPGPVPVPGPTGGGEAPPPRGARPSHPPHGGGAASAAAHRIMPPHGAPQVVPPIRQFMTPGHSHSASGPGSASSYGGSAMKTPSRAWTDVEVSSIIVGWFHA